MSMVRVCERTGIGSHVFYGETGCRNREMPDQTVRNRPRHREFSHNRGRMPCSKRV